jgi:hypothetical protein
MIHDPLTKKLRHYAELGNIDMERCVYIVQAAQDALVEHSRGGDITGLAVAMARCCGRDPDEAAFFRCAVDSLLQEKWSAKPKDSAVLTSAMDAEYQNAVRTYQDASDSTVKLREVGFEYNINGERYRWLVDHAKSATTSFFASGGNLDVYSKDCQVDIFAKALMNCCGSGDEARFFSKAVNSILVEEYNVDDKSASNISKFMLQRCIQVHSNNEVVKNNPTSVVEQKPKSSGCLVILSFVGILPLGVYATRFFLPLISLAFC